MQGPFGHRVGDSAGEMEGGKGVEALDVAAGASYARDAGAVAGEVSGVDLVHGLLADLVGRRPDAAL